MNLHTKRVYDEARVGDGYRVLVDRLWPRGVSKEKARIDLWLKDIGPSDDLRKWFDHRPERFEEFKKRYRAELRDNSAFTQLIDIANSHHIVTLIYSAHDTRHNQAIALVEFITQEEGE